MNIFWRIFFVCTLLVAIGGSFLLGSLFYIAHNQCIDFSLLETYKAGAPSILLDDEGNEWARFQLDKREPVKFEHMPQPLIQAFLAAEDWSFFNHAGISWKGIARSLLVNMYHGRRVQGASTITQQLVKLLFFDGKKTFERKLKEQIYAILIERQFTKEQILETYLNHICFGCGIYGVQAACQRFWGIPVSQINAVQAATLAGIVRSPNNYCPLLYPLYAKKRRNVILHSMRKLNFLAEDEYEEIRKQDLMLKSLDRNVCAPHLKEAIRIYLENELGMKSLYCDGLTIQTTLNKNLQQKAMKIFADQCHYLKNSLNVEIDGAVISMEPKSGEIRVLIGGKDFSKSKFNRALQGRRQMGSIIKPLIYAAALQSGMNFDDTDIDEPFELTQTNGSIWRPNNYNDAFNGKITLAYALSHSNNIVTIKTLLKVGASHIADLVKKCHVQGPLHTYPSLALGCIDVTLKEVTGMFNIFANSGNYIEPHFLKWIKDKWGTKIWKYSAKTEKVVPPRINSQVAQVLTHALERSRKAMRGEWLQSQAISKTGTTNDSRVCWYAGSTPELTTAVYIGCDGNDSMGRNIFPIKTGFPIWFALNKALEPKQKKFNFDPTLVEKVIYEKTGREPWFQDSSDTVTILV